MCNSLCPLGTNVRYKLCKMMLQLVTLGLSMTSILAQSSSCGGTLYGSGNLRSPNYPSNYDNYLRCNWTLIASPYNGNIRLQFLAFSTESCCDFVSIYDSNGTLVRRYSGTAYPSTDVLGSYAVVSFTTDGSVVSSGFSISFLTSVVVVDPCSNYTILNESWRNVHSPLTTYHCDGNLSPGTWYRFMPPAGIAIPETIPATYSCGTAAPMWLNGTHPRNVTSDPVDRVLCANWENIPCYNSITVKVALCPGGYYVYMAPRLTAPACDMAWCAVDANESNCEQQGNFYCSRSQLCVSYYHRCNGYSYCSYGEDEAGCNNLSASTTSTILTPSPRDSCERQGNFYCAYSGLCVAMYQRCNGYSNCYYGEDESGCSPSTPTTTNTITRSQRDSCVGQGNFYCEFSRECIAMWRRCDGYAYCNYGEDESGCGSTTATSRPASPAFPRDSCERQGNFYCAYSGLCVAISQRCNGYSNCYYGEDESGCVLSSPATTNTGRTAASERPQGSFIAASGFVQAFLQLSKSSASELPRGSWIVVSGYVLALLFGLPRLARH